MPKDIELICEKEQIDNKFIINPWKAISPEKTVTLCNTIKDLDDNKYYRLYKVFYNNTQKMSLLEK